MFICIHNRSQVSVYRTIGPLVSVVATLAPSFLFGSSLFLEVTRTSIISQLRSNFDQIRPLTAELSALECLKNQYVVLWPL